MKGLMIDVKNLLIELIGYGVIIIVTAVIGGVWILLLGGLEAQNIKHKADCEAGNMSMCSDSHAAKLCDAEKVEYCTEEKKEEFCEEGRKNFCEENISISPVNRREDDKLRRQK